MAVQKLRKQIKFRVMLPKVFCGILVSLQCFHSLIGHRETVFSVASCYNLVYSKHDVRGC